MTLCLIHAYGSLRQKRRTRSIPGYFALRFKARRTPLAAHAIALPKKNKPESLPLEEQIRQRAFEIYLQRGGQEGSDLDDWQRAEAELQSRDAEAEFRSRDRET
jgi:hypothetical protein